MPQWNSYLEHFGIFGMKWGIRRFQNEDGSLTEEGKKRYNARSRDIGAAKEHVLAGIENDKKSRDFFQKEAESIKKMPRDRSSIKRSMNISDNEYDDALREYGSIDKYLLAEQKYYQHEAGIYSRRIADWNSKMKKLNTLKVDVIMSDKEHMKQIEDIFTQSKGWLWRYIDLHDVHNYINYVRRHPEHKLAIENTNSKSSYKKNKNLTERFESAQKDNPKLTYNQIYKEMKVNLDSEDPDDYKEAEDKWLRKHGY